MTLGLGGLWGGLLCVFLLSRLVATRRRPCRFPPLRFVAAATLLSHRCRRRRILSHLAAVIMYTYSPIAPLPLSSYMPPNTPRQVPLRVPRARCLRDLPRKAPVRNPRCALHTGQIFGEQVVHGEGGGGEGGGGDGGGVIDEILAQK
eukprot:scaffold3541_cov117-Isochrysis_galbana.AAC.6